MWKTRFDDQDIVATIGEHLEIEHDVDLTIALIERRQISVLTLYVWRAKFRGMCVSEVRKLREAEAEIAWLRAALPRFAAAVRRSRWIVAWFGVVASGFTFYSKLPIPKADWVQSSVAQWHTSTRSFWESIFALFGQELPLWLSPHLTLAWFLLLTGIATKTPEYYRVEHSTFHPLGMVGGVVGFVLVTYMVYVSEFHGLWSMQFDKAFEWKFQIAGLLPLLAQIYGNNLSGPTNYAMRVWQILGVVALLIAANGSVLIAL